jgi:hypothetical protein
MTTPSFPGRIVQLGDQDHAVVSAIQQRLVERGCGPLERSGVFDARTRAAVRLFQARFPDRTGAPLVVDGKVGSLTWESLFGQGSVPVASAAADPLLAAMLKVASGEVGVLEDPPGSNRGPRVDEYLRAAGLDPADGSFPWCAAFVFWCAAQATRTPGLGSNPVVRTAGVLTHWRLAGQAGIRRIVSADATADPARLHPGMIFIMDFGGGAGHTGLVEAVDGGRIVTIEGNTNDGGSRDGIGVFRRARKILSINRGFIDYARS